jgi:LmbE family N-acetylglucosaminyl deacetylase
VLAHPDDESFGMGGTLAKYASEGHSVHLICATRGEAGEVAPEYLEGFDSIAARRESELRCAAGILGLDGVHFLDYRDSGMEGSPDNQHPRALAAAPIEEVTGKIVDLIRRLRPDAIITFDPNGGYFHPDHIAINRAAEKAFHAAGDIDKFPGELPQHQAETLYFHVFPRRMFRFWIKVMQFFGANPRQWGRNKDIDLLRIIGEEDYPVHVKVNIRSVMEAKLKADACHASQLDGGPSISRGIFGLIRRLFQHDHFMRAYPETTSKRIETDLFS